MLSRFLLKRRSARSAQRASIPDGQRIYAIGDIHGRLDLVDELLDRIVREDAEHEAPATLIFLGDLVDRGPQSAQVVERLRQLREERPEGATRFLLGNHEEVLLAALAGDEQALRLFTKIGGRETILSYGISEAQYRELSYAELLAAFRQAVPQAHIDFISRFEDIIIAGDYAFVHAGVRPERPLLQQRSKDLRWIREDFLRFDSPFEKIVVHGHTITDEVDIRPNRIGLDTGAYASGRLTAMGLAGDRRWVLQTGS